MTASADPARLTRLDQRPGFTPDERVRRDNLAALAKAAPSLAQRLEATVLPGTWRPVVALDGTPTFRIEAPGDEPRWLAATGVPRVRAEALLEVSLCRENPALSGVLTGIEIVLLLERLEPHQALYVFEADLVRLSAVLLITPLADAIRAGRCLFVPPGREREELLARLESSPGLLPPGQLVCTPDTPPERVAELHAVCERVSAAVREARARRLADALRAAAGPRGPRRAPVDAPRLALLALAFDRAAHRAAGWLAEAAHALGWPACLCTADAPERVDPVHHACRLADFGPDLTIAVGHEPDVVSGVALGTLCRWHTGAPDVPDAPPPGRLRLAAAPTVAAALAAAGVDPLDVVPFLWAVRAARAGRASPPPTVAENTILLLGDCPDPEPRVWGIETESHRRLWTCALRAAADAWQAGRSLEPRRLLSEAERRSGVRVSEASIREPLVRIVAHVAGAAAAAECVLAQARPARVRLQAVGRGWERFGADAVTVLTPDAHDFCDQTPQARLALFFGGEASGPAVLHAAASGIPLAVCSRGAAGDELLELFQPGQDFERIGSAASLRRWMSASQSEVAAARERAGRLRARLLERETYVQRLEALRVRMLVSDGVRS